MERLLWIGLALVGTGFGAFVPPAEGPVPFRRDKLPVDVATMTSLSSQLVSLAAHSNSEDPAKARTRAQMLALAAALDPSNTQAGKVVAALAKGEPIDAPSMDDVKMARTRAWNLLGWLEQPEAGEDGQALGACLGDVLIRIDPEHPLAKDRSGNGEKGDWNGWVAAVAAFRDRETPSMEDGPDDGGTDDPAPESDRATLAMRKATVNIPLWCYNRESRKTTLEVAPLELSAWIKKKDDDEDKGSDEEDSHDPERLRIQFGWKSRGDESAILAERLQPWLASRYGKLPRDLQFRLELPKDLTPSIRNHGSLSGAVVILANAVFSGVEPEGAVLAMIGEEGDVRLPAKFWQTLRALAAMEDLPGERIILPAAALELLPSLLTLDQSEFFIRQEVLLAKDIDSLLAVSSSQPPDAVTAAHAAFEEIRTARGTRSLGSFLDFQSTQQRLTKLVGDCPQHASGRMLALRGTSQWPQRLPRAIYAREIRAAIEPMGDVLRVPADKIKRTQLQATEARCRESLGRVEKFYSSVSDRSELHDPATNTVKLLTGLATDFKRSGDEFFNPAARVAPIYREYVDTLRLLTNAAGDAEEYPLPKLDKGK
ncbi:hypothetical protein HAHE_17670 [Haloferula helveola]|uniref:Uncharacterized protein n=2 Tax=Haloferula helveola TaxID=490095 RepID=A0ABM7RBR2_9BACT|nr:hypothetical protein HAHE_17670 [Haloferula helveola]